MTRSLTPEQVLYIHFRMIRETGGEPGVRDLPSLCSALEQPQSLVNGKEAYPGLYKKAAVLFAALQKAQPFNDGNKRAAIAAVDLFLRMNGNRLGVDGTELVRFSQTSARSPVSLEYLTAWMWQYTRPLQGGRS